MANEHIKREGQYEHQLPSIPTWDLVPQERGRTPLDAFQSVKAHLDAHQWYLRLSTSVFQFNDPEMPAVLENSDDVYQSWKWLHKRVEGSSLPIDELERVCSEVHRLSTRLTTAFERAAPRIEVLNVLLDVLRFGKSLVQQYRILTGLTEGFSFTGSRDRVHDSHFSKLPVYVISDGYLQSLTGSIGKLMRFGQLASLDQATRELNVGNRILNLAAIQGLLMAIGAGMTQTFPGVLFAHPPTIWLGIQQLATDCAVPLSFFARLQREQGIANELHNAIPGVESLIEEARLKSRQSVSLEGFFGSKKGIKGLRRVLATVTP